MTSSARSARAVCSGFLAWGLGVASVASGQEQATNPPRPLAPASVATGAISPTGQAPAASLQTSPASPQTSPAGSPQTSTSGQQDSCGVCGKADCLGLCGSGPNSGLFAIGQPNQVVPPPSGWTLMVPPLPPVPPAPGTKPKPKPPQPWKPLYFDNDFRYVDKPDNTYHNTFDFLKRRELFTENIVTDFGGEFRWQGKAEGNRRLDGKQNNYNLFRERLYLNTWFYDRFRIYGEVYFADSSRQTQRPLPIDIDHGDVNNLFAELRLFEAKQDKGWMSFRYGWHEELLFGNQRLVSPLDWANARRTFDMMPHLLYRGDTWALDLFWSRPNVIKTRALNTPNYDLQFFGSYLTYKGAPNRLYDFYYLGLLSDSAYKGTLNGETGNFQVQTLGMRWQGEQENWLWEGETAYQFGQHFDKARKIDIPRNAGMLTAGFGRRFAEVFSKPELWFYFDYASGSTGRNSYATFNQLFPLGHKYFGYMDIVGRQNMLDPNVNLKFFLSPRVNLLLWYHNLQLASAKDALYNAAGNPIRRDPTGRSGRYVGNEIDIAINLIVNPNSDFQIGISQFFAGSFVEDTAKTTAQGQGGSFFYTQFTVRF